MTDAPEHIWIDKKTETTLAGTQIGSFWTAPHKSAKHKYVRADLHAAALEENERLRVALAEKFSFEKADWFWRVMDPDDSGDNPEEAVNRALVGRFCVCQIASSFTGPVRYGFIAPVLDPESDDEEFVHFATHQEAIDAAKTRAAITPAQEDKA